MQMPMSWPQLHEISWQRRVYEWPVGWKPRGATSLQICAYVVFSCMQANPVNPFQKHLSIISFPSRPSLNFNQPLLNFSQLSVSFQPGKHRKLQGFGKFQPAFSSKGHLGELEEGSLLGLPPSQPFSGYPREGLGRWPLGLKAG